MKDAAESGLAATFREHPGLLVSALYIAASVVGMFYSWTYLRNFGINVFNYAQISDFLLASLKEPLTWGLVAVGVAVVAIDNASSRRVERKGPSKWVRWYGSPRYRIVNNIAAIFIILMFIYAFANVQAGKTLRGGGKIVGVTFAEGGAVETAVLLGTTSQFVFLYEVSSRKVDIHPIESIHAITFQAD